RHRVSVSHNVRERVRLVGHGPAGGLFRLPWQRYTALAAVLYHRHFGGLHHFLGVLPRYRTALRTQHIRPCRGLCSWLGGALDRRPVRRAGGGAPLFLSTHPIGCVGRKCSDRTGKREHLIKRDHVMLSDTTILVLSALLTWLMVCSSSGLRIQARKPGGM